MEASALQAPAGISRFSVSAPLMRLRSDEQLVALFRAGNEQAFGVIHDRYRQRLFAYTRQMLAGSRQDAEDALQDVFLRAYGALRADDRPVTLRAWLYRVAHNRCIDQLRRITPAPADVMDVSRTPLHDPLDEAQRREDLRRLVADVRRLPEQQRSALLMRELEGLSYAELAAALGVTVPAVKSLLVRARIGLAEAMEARDTACCDVRADLALAHGRGVRSSALARRHLRDCSACRDYKTGLRSMQKGFAALSPSSPGPLAMLLKIIGIGGAGSGAAAGTSGVAGGGAALTGGGITTGVLSGTAGVKVAAIVCGAAITAGGAVEVHHTVLHTARTPVTASAPAASAASRTATPSGTELRALRAAAPSLGAGAAGATAGATTIADPTHHRAGAQPADEAVSPHVADDPSQIPLSTAGQVDAAQQAGAGGGVAAPQETTDATPAPGASSLPADPAAANATPNGGTASPSDPTAPVAAIPAAPAAAQNPAEDPAAPIDDDASPAAPGTGGFGMPAGTTR